MSDERHETHDAFAVHTFGHAAGIVMTCEHASERVPEAFAQNTGFAWPEADRWLRGTHWSYDLGAEEIALAHARAVGATLVCARFSRLLIDPNRPLDASTLFRDVAEGRAITMNRDLSARARQARIEQLYEPFHDAVDRAVAASTKADIVFAVHTFTHEYEGQRRTLELGVLFDREDALGARVLEGLRAAGFDAAANEPWSGKAGLIHVASHHGDRYGKRALELEVRQDLATNAAFRARLVSVLADLLR
ncbi:MAG: N-formylglutamate amidohydrolase [Sandaracinus sp.]|jgi:predicted N-formylglutamate amidohydrolase